MLSSDHARAAYASARDAVATQAEIDRCQPDDSPILRMLLHPCPPGMHGFRCDVRWDVSDSFLPTARRWVRQWNATNGHCQRAFFAAFAEVLTRVHWENEWDAQPFRIAATPPRTMGKMLHQLTTVNYFHLTAGRLRPPIARRLAPGERMRAMPQPGFRWNVLDYGGGQREPVDYKRLQTMPGNVFSRPLSGSTRCADNGLRRAAWHCLWQRFPQQQLAPSPARGTPVAAAAALLYNLSYEGKAHDELAQYLVAGTVVDVFTQPTRAVRSQTPGPFNAMFERGKKTGRLERVPRRKCYTWSVYRRALDEMRELYGVQTVVVVTDDHEGAMLRSLASDSAFNWVYLDFDRKQFRKQAWMEFRSELDEHAPFSLAAELELLATADVFVGNMGSHTSRMMYMKIIGASRTALLPPFVSVDGYGLCCGFTDECTKAQIRKRGRSIRQCIYTYGLATGGEMYFYH
ncbi:hypothetical protein Ctob_011571 [Chrysochromulina tobinii]|uniref:Uncharacterized protein n=1 Tax=Chrysochromulina tobinii TaxID=1460289 RepID=A0A0M0JVQ0_9EUKA|nr:hypothetical protein Ctob_011571 [Chrysochromulina tobinii]|eukprot:KOO30756.1 hypothetical protein Ctob_011571 [Chrysochromulina sp. CCMP291]